MKNSKVIEEEISALAIEAKALYAAAKNQGREFSDEEATRFEEITNKTTGQIANLEKDKAKALAIEAEIFKLSEENRRTTTVENLDRILDRPANAPRETLPTNGRLPEDRRSLQPVHRLGKLKAFKNERDAFDSGMFMRAMVAQMYNRTDKAAVAHCHRLGWEVSNAGVEGVGSLGGFLVPAPIAAAIIDVRERVGVTRSLLNIQPMTADTLLINKRAGGLTVFYGTENPGSDMTASDKSWAQLELVAKKRYVVHQISQELVDDALISVVDDAINEMGYALALNEDREVVNGDGTGAYGNITGLVPSLGAAGTHTAATGHDTWPELDIADFTAAMGLLPDQYNISPAWITSSNFYHTAMLNVLASAGGNTIGSLQTGEGMRPQFLGASVFFTNQMPTSTAASTVSALFGNFSMAAILAERTGIRIGRSDEFAFLRDLVTLKATTRYDVKVHAGGDATDAGAYIGLQTSA